MKKETQKLSKKIALSETRNNMNISRKELSSFIDDRYIKRGAQIVGEGTIILEKIHPDRIEAYAIGTSIYRVNLFRSAPLKQLKGTCNCPAFFDFGPCKHIAAAGLACIQRDYKPDEWSYEQIKIFKNVLQVLHKQSRENLINIIMDCIAQDQELLYLIQQLQNIKNSNE